MDLRAPGVRVARFPQTPRKVYSSTCQSRTPPTLQTVVLAHTSPHYPRYANVPLHMHLHTLSPNVPAFGAARVRL